MPTPTAPFPTADLVRFLLARLDDEDAQFRRRSRTLRGSDAESDTRIDGTAVLDRERAESHARRQVIGIAQQLLVLRDQPNEKAVRDAAVHILRALAAPYADHSGFRSEWMPTGH